jgi:hypothetical protein
MSYFETRLGFRLLWGFSWFSSITQPHKFGWKTLLAVRYLHFYSAYPSTLKTEAFISFLRRQPYGYSDEVLQNCGDKRRLTWLWNLCHDIQGQRQRTLLQIFLPIHYSGMTLEFEVEDTQLFEILKVSLFLSVRYFASLSVFVYTTPNGGHYTNNTIPTWIAFT